jgi:hypothetical protein
LPPLGLLSGFVELLSDFGGELAAESAAAAFL